MFRKFDYKSGGLHMIGKSIMKYSVFLLLFSRLLISYSKTVLDIPSSFSRNHHDNHPSSSSSSSSYSISKVSTLIIKQILDSFELQSHIDVVFVGNKKLDIMDDVISILNRISSIAYSHSMYNINQKPIYHTSIANPSVFTKLTSLESGMKPYFNMDIEKILLEDFHRRLSVNVLYLILSPIPSSWLQRSCPPPLYQGYMSSSANFGWLYVYSSFSSSSPSLLSLSDAVISSNMDHIVNYPTLSGSLGLNSVSVASMIAKASESILSNVKSHVEFNPLSVVHIRTVTLVIVNVCFDEVYPATDHTNGVPCDSMLTKKNHMLDQILSKLTDVYFAVGLKLITSTVTISLQDNIDIAHALFLSLLQYSTDTININSNKLSQLLSMTISWKKILSEYCESLLSMDSYPIEITIPILSISSNRQLIINEKDRKLSVTEYIETSDSNDDPWYVTNIENGKLLIDDEAKARVDRLIYPNKMIIIANGNNPKITKQVSCRHDGENRIFHWEITDPAYISRDIYHSIQFAVWGMLPNYEYFSPFTGKMVHDLLWDDIPTEDKLKLSFHEKRHLFRHLIIYKTQYLIQKFNNLISTIDSSIPGLNTTVWLENRLYDRSIPIDIQIFSMIQKSSNGIDYVQRFLNSMEELALSYSHEQYNECLTTIKNIENMLTEIMKNIHSYASTRYGKLIASNNTWIEIISNSSKESDEVIIQSSSQFFIRWILSFAFIFIGIILGLRISDNISMNMNVNGNRKKKPSVYY